MSDNLYLFINEGNLLDINTINTSNSVLVGNILSVNNSSFLEGVTQCNANLNVFGIELYNDNDLINNGALYCSGYAQFDSNVVFNGITQVFEGNVLCNAALVVLNNISDFSLPGGNSGEVLTTDGAGNLYWSSASGGGLANIPYGDYTYTTMEPASNTTTTPVDITTFSSNIQSEDFAVPKYIIGTNVNANYVFPAYQNTSTTANGYGANSTGVWQPAFAARLNINNGDDDWYVLEYTTTTTANLDSLQYAGQMYMVSNVDATIQLLPFITRGNNLIQSEIISLQTVELKANLPICANVFDSRIDAASSIDGAGILIRNMNANTNVTCFTSRFFTYQLILP